MTSDEPPRVFISYAWGTPEHQEQVRQFADFLRVEVGIDVILDRWYEDYRRDWAAWASKHLDEVDFILIIASPDYKRRADGQAAPDEGRGAQYEAAIIRNLLMRNLSEETRRLLPVVLPGGSDNDIPSFLCGHSVSHYHVDALTRDGAETLLRALAGQPIHPRPPRGRYNPIQPRNNDDRDTTTPSIDQTDNSHAILSGTTSSMVNPHEQPSTQDADTADKRRQGVIGKVEAREVSITGGVHGAGPGITIGAVTGDYLTLTAEMSGLGQNTPDPQ